MDVRAPDPGELADRLKPHVATLGNDATVTEVHRLPVGLSGITYMVSVAHADGGDRFVLKVAPTGVAPTKNRDVLRQAKILSLLADQPGVPVPRVLFTDDGKPPDIPPFYATKFINGVNTEPMDEEDSPVAPREILHARYLDAARVLANMQRMPVGGTRFGDARVDSPSDELAKWNRVFEAVPEDLRGDSRALTELLGKAVPEPAEPVLVHGDYRLGNTICDGPGIAALIDWELWSLGDPRLDLAWLLHMSDPAIETVRRPLPGVPTRNEIIAAYQGGTASLVRDLSWFEALTLYKRAAASALIVKYNRRAAEPDPRKEDAERVIEPLLAAARRTLD